MLGEAITETQHSAGISGYPGGGDDNTAVNARAYLEPDYYPALEKDRDALAERAAPLDEARNSPAFAEAAAGLQPDAMAQAAEAAPAAPERGSAALAR